VTVEKTVARKIQKEFGLKYMMCRTIALRCKAEAETEYRKLRGELDLTPEELQAKKDKEIDDRILRGLSRRESQEKSGTTSFSEVWYQIARKYIKPGGNDGHEREDRSSHPEPTRPG
jgi:hypothetical protein